MQASPLPPLLLDCVFHSFTCKRRFRLPRITIRLQPDPMEVATPAARAPRTRGPAGLRSLSVATRFRFLEHLGMYFGLIWWMVRNIRNARESSTNFFSQMVQIGNDSIPIVVFVSTFVGMVTAVQSAYQLYSWIPRSVVGGLVIKSVLLELTPLLTALVLAGKVGATITAEIGSMRVTEQVDALEAMGFDSVSFLITPRVLAGVVMFPVLVVFGDLLAVLGGLFGAVIVAHIPAGAFIAGMKSSFLTRDAVFGLDEGDDLRIHDHVDRVVPGVLSSSAVRPGVGKATMSTVVVHLPCRCHP